MRTTALDLDALELQQGDHMRREQGVCLLEAVAWVAGEPHGDHPKCVSPALANYGRVLNDALPDDRRQRLKPYVTRLVGTAGQPDLDRRVGLMAADWIVRVYTPVWLRAAKLDAEAASLEQLPEVTSWDVLEQVTPTVRAAHQKAAAARAAAWDAAGAAAWDAAGAAAWEAARDALKPTVDRLQDSAIDLYGRMIAVADECRAVG